MMWSRSDNPNIPATAVVSLSLELVTQIAAPDFDLKLNLHRAMLKSAQ
jgi:hypothetical protein